MITFILGGLGGIIMTVLGRYILASVTRWRLQLSAGNRFLSGASLLLLNRSPYTLSQTSVHISIKHRKRDIAPGSPDEFWMTPDSNIPIRECALCWDMMQAGKNPAQMDIFPAQTHGITFVRLEHEDRHVEDRSLRIASETGIGDRKGEKSRVRLLWKEYETIVSVYSADSLARHWLVKIQPDNQTQPLQVVRPIGAKEKEATLVQWASSFLS